MDKIRAFRKSLEVLSNAAYCNITPAQPYISLDHDRSPRKKYQ